jgi:glutathione S-transferase
VRAPDKRSRAFVGKAACPLKDSIAEIALNALATSLLDWTPVIAASRHLMIQLHGTPLSNYYNKVKLALLEKGLAFSEHLVRPGTTEPGVLKASPAGKIPYLLTPEGPLSESQAILDYLEALQPEPPLLPSSPYVAAKVRELCLFIDLNLELVVRPLYAQAFFGAEPDAALAARIRPLLEKNLLGFQRLARFSPYVAGDHFTFADCCAWVSLPLLGLATKVVYGENFLHVQGLDIKPYTQLIEQRGSAQRVKMEREVVQRAMIAKGKVG